MEVRRGAVSNYFISIHAPREGRDLTLSAEIDKWQISIHAPREGRDLSL